MLSINYKKYNFITIKLYWLIFFLSFIIKINLFFFYHIFFVSLYNLPVFLFKKYILNDFRLFYFYNKKLIDFLKIYFIFNDKKFSFYGYKVIRRPYYKKLFLSALQFCHIKNKNFYLDFTKKFRYFNYFIFIDLLHRFKNFFFLSVVFKSYKKRIIFSKSKKKFYLLFRYVMREKIFNLNKKIYNISYRAKKQFFLKKNIYNKFLYFYYFFDYTDLFYIFINNVMPALFLFNDAAVSINMFKNIFYFYLSNLVLIIFFNNYIAYIFIYSCLKFDILLIVWPAISILLKKKKFFNFKTKSKFFNYTNFNFITAYNKKNNRLHYFCCFKPFLNFFNINFFEYNLFIKNILYLNFFCIRNKIKSFLFINKYYFYFFLFFFKEKKFNFLKFKNNFLKLDLLADIVHKVDFFCLLKNLKKLYLNDWYQYMCILQHRTKFFNFDTYCCISKNFFRFNTRSLFNLKLHNIYSLYGWKNKFFDKKVALDIRLHGGKSFISHNFLGRGTRKALIFFRKIIKFIFNLKIRRQWTLTRYLLRFKRIYFSIFLGYFNYSMQLLLLRSKLLYSYASILDAVKCGFIFLNGFCISTPFYFINKYDILELVVSQKIYLFLKFFKNFFLNKNKLTLLFKFKHYFMRWQKIGAVRLVFFDLFKFFEDIPSNLEVDFLSLSFIFLYDFIYYYQLDFFFFFLHILNLLIILIENF